MLRWRFTDERKDKQALSLARRIGIGFHPTDARQAVDFIARSEEAGFGTAWAVMSPIDRDTLTILAAAAMQTDRIHLGTAVVPAFTRHPLSLVTQVLVLEDLAPGRIRLGLGSSHRLSMAPAYGLPFTRPLAQLREYLSVVRTLLQEGSFAFAGEFYTGEATLRFTPGTPVLMSALRQHAFELAGELADGAISWVCPPRYLREVALPAMREGAARAGRALPPLIAHVLVAPSDDIDQVRAEACNFLTYYTARPFYRSMFADAGYPSEVDQPLSHDLVDALVISGDEHAILGSLREHLTWADELIVSVIPVGGERSADDKVFQLISRL